MDVLPVSGQVPRNDADLVPRILQLDGSAQADNSCEAQKRETMSER